MEGLLSTKKKQLFKLYGFIKDQEKHKKKYHFWTKIVKNGIILRFFLVLSKTIHCKELGFFCVTFSAVKKRQKKNKFFFNQDAKWNKKMGGRSHVVFFPL